MHAAVDERPHEDVGEEVLEYESGDEGLLGHKMHRGITGFRDQVVEAEEAGDQEVEHEAVERCQTWAGKGGKES